MEEPVSCLRAGRRPQRLPPRFPSRISLPRALAAWTTDDPSIQTQLKPRPQLSTPCLPDDGRAYGCPGTPSPPCTCWMDARLLRCLLGDPLPRGRAGAPPPGQAQDSPSLLPCCTLLHPSDDDDDDNNKNDKSQSQLLSHAQPPPPRPCLPRPCPFRPQHLVQGTAWNLSEHLGNPEPCLFPSENNGCLQQELPRLHT